MSLCFAGGGESAARRLRHRRRASLGGADRGHGVVHPHPQHRRSARPAAAGADRAVLQAVPARTTARRAIPGGTGVPDRLRRRLAGLGSRGRAGHQPPTRAADYSRRTARPAGGFQPARLLPAAPDPRPGNQDDRPVAKPGRTPRNAQRRRSAANKHEDHRKEAPNAIGRRPVRAPGKEVTAARPPHAAPRDRPSPRSGHRDSVIAVRTAPPTRTAMTTSMPTSQNWSPAHLHCPASSATSSPCS